LSVMADSSSTRRIFASDSIGNHPSPVSSTGFKILVFNLLARLSAILSEAHS
jgi:hypothetical protein